MFKKSRYKVLVFVGLITLILVFCLPKHTTGQIKVAIGSLFLPLFGLSRAANQITTQAGEAITSRAELLRQNEELRRTNELLRIQSDQNAAILLENNRLRQQLNWQKTTPWKDRLKRAHVIGRDPANWWQNITIDLGTTHGMKEDLPVMTDEGLVGRITSTGPLQSIVVLISSPECKVSGVIREQRELGVISGSASPINNSLVRLRHLPANSTVKPGMMVYSSGSGGVFPAGITIGKIAEDPRTMDLGQSGEARVKLTADLNALDEVWVLTMP